MHELLKQLSAFTLPILGILVSGNDLTFTMMQDTRHCLLTSIHGFINSKVKILQACHALAGYINWSLNVFPCLRHGLASLYMKMTGPYLPNQKVHINEDIVWDLSWLAQHIKLSTSVFLLKLIAWDPATCDLEIIDASLSSIGMWSPTIHVTYHAPILSSQASTRIFFHEAFMVCCAICWAANLAHSFPTPIHQVVIYTDNSNTINIFISLKVHGVFNVMLKFTVDILLTYDFDLQVIYLAGSDNMVADLLSHQCLDNLFVLKPDLHVLPSIPLKS